MTWISGWIPGWTGSWFGPESPAPAGAMTFYVSGVGLLTGAARGTGRASAVLAGHGVVTTAAIGRGELALSAHSGSTVVASIIGTAGGPTFGDMSASIVGTGGLAWKNTAIHPSQMEFWVDNRPKAQPKPKPIHRALRSRVDAHGSVTAVVRADGLITARIGGASTVQADALGRFEPAVEQLAIAIFAAYRRAA